jgi:hypothetical protein
MDPDAGLPVSAVSRVRFEDAIRAFHAECFWWWDVGHPVATKGVAREVIRQLRLHGGKQGWRTAAELVRCL